MKICLYPNKVLYLQLSKCKKFHIFNFEEKLDILRVLNQSLLKFLFNTEKFENNSVFNFLRLIFCYSYFNVHKCLMKWKRKGVTKNLKLFGWGT